MRGPLEALSDGPRGAQVGADPPDDLPAQVAKPVFSALLLEEDVLARPGPVPGTAVLDLSVELAEDSDLLPSEIRPSDQLGRKCDV